jgi:hypothetical protein
MERGLPVGLRGFARKPWVARIVGTDPTFKFRREFAKGWKDFAESNSVGSRGVYACYDLESGVYEIHELTSWKNSQRYFLFVWPYGDDSTRVTKEEVVEWLKNEAGTNAGSASTS